MKGNLIVDRVTADTYVCEAEDGYFYTFSKQSTLIPKGAKEGDVLVPVNYSYKVDKHLTDQRRAIVTEKYNKVFGD